MAATTAAFPVAFVHELRALGTAGAANSTAEELRGRLNALGQQLQDYYKQLSTTRMTNYDRMKANRQFAQLQRFLSATREKALPRQRFCFASRRFLQDEEVTAEGAAIQASYSEFDVHDLRGVETTVQGTVRSVQECADCTFRLPAIQQLFIFRCSGCTFLQLDCASACYLEGCDGCTIVGRAHQLRFCNCSACEVAVDVNGPIIEKCRNMRFKRPAQAAARWNHVVDFSWLRNDIPSGNFTVEGE